MKPASQHTTDELILQMVGISKEFPGAKALDAVDFDLKEAEVHALVGENGAGKSTLIKILAGVYRPDAGRIMLSGRNVPFKNTRAMLDRGVSVIYQELSLVPYLSVAENIFLGREPRTSVGSIGWKKMRERAREIIDSFELNIDPKAKVATLGIAHQQIVEIAKALSLQSRIIVMDEPTATLTGHEVDKLFSIVADLKRRGVSVIYISHRLEEIGRIADRVTVLRDGRRVLTRELKDITTDQIIHAMVGRDIGEKYPKKDIPTGEELLRVERLSAEGLCRDISFDLRSGEILGIAGLVGAGRTEMVQLLVGYRKKGSGTISVKGRTTRIRKPFDAVRAGIGLIPEERRSHGLVPELSVFENAALTVLDRFSSFGLLKRRQLRASVTSAIDNMKVKAATTRQKVKTLSGGNQQKIVLAKWFLRHCHIYIFDEPTRGIDVAAKTEIYRLMEELAASGAGIIMISAELPELLNISDRILVMRDGAIVKEFPKGAATAEDVLSHAIGYGKDSTDRAEPKLGDNE